MANYSNISSLPLKVTSKLDVFPSGAGCRPVTHALVTGLHDSWDPVLAVQKFVPIAIGEGVRSTEKQRRCTFPFAPLRKSVEKVTLPSAVKYFLPPEGGDIYEQCEFP